MPQCVGYCAQAFSNQPERFTPVPFPHVLEKLPAVPDFSKPLLFPILPLSERDKLGGHAYQRIAQ